MPSQEIGTPLPQGQQSLLTPEERKKAQKAERAIGRELDIEDPDSRVGRVGDSYFIKEEKGAILASSTYNALSEEDRNAFNTLVEQTYHFSLTNPEPEETPNPKDRPHKWEQVQSPPPPTKIGLSHQIRNKSILKS